jgi:hypothetical protein
MLTHRLDTTKSYVVTVFSCIKLGRLRCAMTRFDLEDTHPISRTAIPYNGHLDKSSGYLGRAVHSIDTINYSGLMTSEIRDRKNLIQSLDSLDSSDRPCSNLGDQNNNGNFSI